MGPYHAIMVHFPVALWIVASAIVLFRALSDAQPAVRAKVVRSLGKLARFGHLDRAGL